MKVAGQTVELEMPVRASIRHAITISAIHERSTDEHRARCVVAASLMLCWSGLSHKVGLPRYHQNLVEYGEQCLDFLLDGGGTIPEIMAAGNAAIELVSNDAITLDQLEAARGNSTASAESSSGGGSLGGIPGGPTAG